ncbi:MAG: SpoIVB peptidase [Romboutsia sp.]|uniref:SpoIVB peptidase n=1 Tax=Romboutsia sp. TaxID=1965302 RepID=UPI003F3D6AF8
MREKLNINKVSFYIALLCFILSINILINEKKSPAYEVFNNKSNKTYVYPLGNIIGVRANTDGVLVVGYEEEDVEYIGGLQRGDNIIEVNDIKIKNSEDISNIIRNSKDGNINVTFERDKKHITENIKLKKENGEYKLGIWVRDKISGIGTATFYDPNLKQFKAIGHAITDVDTNELLKIKEGNIYKPINLEIIKADDNNHGKIKGEFDTTDSIGRFNSNSKFGISGKLDSEKYNEIQLIQVADSEEVELGPAMILFEDANGNVQSYDVTIKNLIKDEKNEKNMVIEVIDKNLLSYTGGIIQGMSGSPIIQNNKIIGAITHVFKDNPKKGYGIFIDEMLE